MAEIAIIHFTNYPKGQSRSCMAAVMKYTMRDEKTLWEDQQLVSGINCRPESVYDDFLRTKLLYHKDGGTMFYHMVQSFPAGEQVDPAVAHAAALRLAEYFEGREVLVSTHVDRDHIHSHFLINSVSFENGKKLHISEPELTELRQHNDQVCMEFGLPAFQPQKKKQNKAMSGAEYHVAAKGESWKFRLMNTIDECMKFAHDRQEFIALMRSEGCDVRWTDSRKNITYTTPGGKRCRDDRLHDEKYLKENMENEFRIREELINGRTAPAEYATDNTAPGVASNGGGVGEPAGLDRRSASAGEGTKQSPVQLKFPEQPPQAKTLTQDVAAIRELLQQAGKKKERRFSIPHISLPRPNWVWLMVPVVLVGLAVLWYSSVTILNALGM